jgi:hypothetical protein
VRVAMLLPLMALSAAGTIVHASPAALASPASPASPASDDGFDDPKLARRLRSRTTLGGSPGSTESSLPVLAATPSRPSPPSSSSSSSAPAPASRSAAPEVTVSATGSPAVEGAPHLDGHQSLKAPWIGIGYRRFSFVQLGATDPASTSGAAAGEAFNSLSLDFYPVSGSIRFGLSTQYGWQDGRFDSGNGDYFIAESASLGIQRPGPRLTPFAEAFAGGGYMRRFQFDRTIPTAYWQFGIDAGASVFLADHGFVSLALGYLRPVNGFFKEQSFTSVYVDTWSLKLGFGL